MVFLHSCFVFTSPGTSRTHWAPRTSRRTWIQRTTWLLWFAWEDWREGRDCEHCMVKIIRRYVATVICSLFVSMRNRQQAAGDVSDCRQPNPIKFLRATLSSGQLTCKSNICVVECDPIRFLANKFTNSLPASVCPRSRGCLRVPRRLISTHIVQYKRALVCIIHSSGRPVYLGWSKHWPTL